MPTRGPLLILTVVALAVLPLAAAVPHAGLGAAPDQGCRPGTVFENDEVRIWFHGRKGMVKVFDRNVSDGADGAYMYKTHALVERSPENVTVASMNLERAFPKTSRCTIAEDDTFVNMTLEITDEVRSSAGGALGSATVAFVYSFNKTADGAKFDLHVAGWPWQGDGDLAFDFRVFADGYEMEEAENGIGFRDENGETAGYVEWAPTANATYEDGHDEVAVVASEVAVSGSVASVRLAFTEAAAGYTALMYDPVLSVGDYVIVAGRLVVLPRAPTRLALPLAGGL